MAEQLSREELIELVTSIMTLREAGTGRKLGEAEHHALVMKFVKAVGHPGGTDLIYYPQLVGLPPEPTAEEIVDFALGAG